MKNSKIATYVCFPKTLKYLTQALQFELLSQGGLLSCSFLFLVGRVKDKYAPGLGVWPHEFRNQTF